MNDLDKIENSIAHARKVIAKGDALQRLMDNSDFKAVVLDAYLKDEPVRMVHYYGSGIGSPEEKAEIERDMHGVGALKSFFSLIMTNASQADSDLQSALAAREEYIAQAQANEEEVFTEDRRGLGA